MSYYRDLALHLRDWHYHRVGEIGSDGSLTLRIRCACGLMFDFTEISEFAEHLKSVDREEHWLLFRLAALAD